jgi:hypothetical protein
MNVSEFKRGVALSRWKAKEGYHPACTNEVRKVGDTGANLDRTGVQPPTKCLREVRATQFHGLEGIRGSGWKNGRETAISRPVMVQAGRHSFDYPDREAREAARSGELSPALSEFVLPEGERLAEVASRLGAESPVTRADAATALGAAFSRRLAATLLADVSRLLLSDPAPSARSACAWCLCQWGELARPALPELVEATRDEDASVRLWSVRALARLDLERVDVPAVLPALVERLGDIDGEIRISAEAGVARHSQRL